MHLGVKGRKGEASPYGGEEREVRLGAPSKPILTQAVLSDGEKRRGEGRALLLIFSSSLHGEREIRHHALKVASIMLPLLTAELRGERGKGAIRSMHYKEKREMGIYWGTSNLPTSLSVPTPGGGKRRKGGSSVYYQVGHGEEGEKKGKPPAHSYDVGINSPNAYSALVFP